MAKGMRPRSHEWPCAMPATAMPCVTHEVDGDRVVERISRFLREVRAEMRKVVWPDRRQTTAFTIVVLASTAFIALLIWGFDSLLNLLLGLIIHVNA